LDRLEQYYQETYVIFEQGNHEEVLNRIRGVEDKFGLNNVMMGKFELLKAMSLGAQIGKEAYVDALKYIVARYPNSEEERKHRICCCSWVIRILPKDMARQAYRRLNLL
jgi:hypothetical protein